MFTHFILLALMIIESICTDAPTMNTTIPPTVIQTNTTAQPVAQPTAQPITTQTTTYTAQPSTDQTTTDQPISQTTTQPTTAEPSISQSTTAQPSSQTTNQTTFITVDISGKSIAEVCSSDITNDLDIDKIKTYIESILTPGIKYTIVIVDNGIECNAGRRRLLLNNSTSISYNVEVEVQMTNENGETESQIISLVTNFLNNITEQISIECNGNCTILNISQPIITSNEEFCTSVSDCVNQVMYLYDQTNENDFINENDITILITQIENACQDENGETNTNLFANAMKSLVSSMQSTTDFGNVLNKASILKNASINAWEHLHNDCKEKSDALKEEIKEDEENRDTIINDIKKRNDLLNKQETDKMKKLLPYLRQLYSKQVKDHSNCIDCDDSTNPLLSNVANKLSKLQELSNQNIIANDAIFDKIFETHSHDNANFNEVIQVINDKISDDTRKLSLFDQCMNVANTKLAELNDGLDFDAINNEILTIETNSQSEIDAIDTELMESVNQVMRRIQ